MESQKFSSSFFCHSRAVMRINNNVMNYTFDGSRVFFTSDTHFNHTNIIRFCDRPFGSTEEMNEKLIGNWNSVVGPDDIVFHLGDFCLGGSAEWTKVLDRLNGKIYLIGDAIEGQYVAGNLHFAAAIAFILMVILLASMAIAKWWTQRHVYGGV